MVRRAGQQAIVFVLSALLQIAAEQTASSVRISAVCIWVLYYTMLPMFQGLYSIAGSQAAM